MLSVATACIYDDVYSPVNESNALQFRIISGADSKISYQSQYKTVFAQGDQIGCVVASKSGEDFTFVENIQWTYKELDGAAGGVLMLGQSTSISPVEDQTMAGQGFVELTDGSMNYAFFFYYPYSSDVTSGTWTSRRVGVNVDQSSEDNLYASDFLWTRYVLDQKTQEDITSGNANYPVYLTFEKKTAVLDIHCEKEREQDGTYNSVITDPSIEIDGNNNTVVIGAPFDLSAGLYGTSDLTTQNQASFKPYKISDKTTESVYRMHMTPQTMKEWGLKVKVNVGTDAQKDTTVALQDQFTNLEEGKLYIIHIAPKGNGHIQIVDWLQGGYGQLVPEDNVETAGPHVTRVLNETRANASIAATRIIARPGETVVIEGVNFDLVNAVKIVPVPDDPSVEVQAVEAVIAVSDDGKTITFEFPDFEGDWYDGEIVLVTKAYADVAANSEMKAGDYELPVPDFVVSRNGLTLTLTGTDLDLALASMGGSVTRPDEAQTNVTYNDGTMTMSLAKFVHSVTLSTSYGKSATVEYDYTPVFESFDKQTVTPGEQLTITGRNLDLVNCVVFEDNVEDNVVYTRGTPHLEGIGETLTVTVPPGSKTGILTFRREDWGESVKTAQLTVNELSGSEEIIWEYVSPYHNPQTEEERKNYDSYQIAQQGKDHAVTQYDGYVLPSWTADQSTDVAHSYDWTGVSEGDLLVICVDRNANWLDWEFDVKYGNSTILHAVNTSGVVIPMTADMIDSFKTNGLSIDVAGTEGSDEGRVCRVDKIAVMKQPAVHPVPALTNYWRDGSSVIFEGTDLNLIDAVYLGGNMIYVDRLSDTQIRINDGSALGMDGTLRFVSTYGDEVSLKYEFYPEVTRVTDESGNAITTMVPGQRIFIEGDNLDLVNLVSFNESGQYVRVTPTIGNTDTVLELVVPAGAQGSNEISLRDVTNQYRDTYAITVNPLEGTETVVYGDGSQEFDWSTLAAGDCMLFYVTPPSENWYDWSFTLNTVTYKNSTGAVIVLDQDSVNYLKENKFNSSDITLANCTLAKVVVLSKSSGNETPQPTVTYVAGFKPGGTTSVTGSDLDQVAYVTVPGPNGTTLRIEKNQLNVNNEKTSMTFTLPETTCSGTMCFYDSSDILVSSGSFNVVEPVFVSFSNNSVNVGESLTINGNDLDLVRSITFGGEVTVDVATDNPSAITVTVPSGAQTGSLKLNLANGSYVETESLTIGSGSQGGGEEPDNPGTGEETVVWAGSAIATWGNWAVNLSTQCDWTQINPSTHNITIKVYFKYEEIQHDSQSPYLRLYNAWNQEVQDYEVAVDDTECEMSITSEEYSKLVIANGGKGFMIGGHKVNINKVTMIVTENQQN